jgi:peptidoglycan/xylan/chitin deacetylase (PgdA/CDA1 family)
MIDPPFDYSPLPRRPRIEWPGGARLAVWVGVNVEHYHLDKPSISIVPATTGLVPDPANYGWRDYGVRVGLWRLVDVLERHGMPMCALVNAEVCDHYPELVEEGRARGWTWLAHGQTNSGFQTEMNRDEELDSLRRMTETIERHTGTRPRGWLGPALTETFDTPSLLAELGYDYVCDWCNDDQPYPLRVEGRRMISVPYSIEVNDIPLLATKGMTGPDFERVLIDQFDGLYAAAEDTGLVMAIALHPFLVGLPFRLGYLDRALAHIAGHDGVWLTTGDEIADWYLDHFYDAAGPAPAGERRLSSS